MNSKCKVDLPVEAMYVLAKIMVNYEEDVYKYTKGVFEEFSKAVNKK